MSARKLTGSANAALSRRLQTPTTVRHVKYFMMWDRRWEGVAAPRSATQVRCGVPLLRVFFLGQSIVFACHGWLIHPCQVTPATLLDKPAVARKRVNAFY